MEQFDGAVNQGRKGIAYDWQSLTAEAEIARLEAALASCTPATSAPGAP